MKPGLLTVAQGDICLAMPCSMYPFLHAPGLTLRKSLLCKCKPNQVSNAVPTTLTSPITA